METEEDVLLVGGGQLDVGLLTRASPFVGAEAIRARFPTRWLPGCHAEALLVGLKPEIGLTTGVVRVARAEAVAAANDALGWTVLPLHLQTWLVPEALIEQIRR